MKALSLTIHDMANVKVFADRQTNRPTDGQTTQKLYVFDIYAHAMK
jgi:hypothetical protein